MSSQASGRLAKVWGRPWEIMADRGEGAYVWDESGRKFLDFTSGIGVLNTGHRHPRVLEAVRGQLDRVVHAQANIFLHRPILSLADALTEVLPAGLDRFFFSNSGAEAVEASLKLARHATGRPNIIAFEGGFHGRTMAAMSITSAKAIYRAGYQPLMAGVFFSTFVADPDGGDGDPQAVAAGLDRLRTVLKTQSAPSETAAMIVEPVLGEGGYHPIARKFLEGVRSICDEYGILLILDEIQSGAGRTGAFIAAQHYGVDPDILILAKGVASGFPLSAIAAPAAIMDRWLPGAHGGTYGGNAVSCAAARATVRVIHEEGLCDRARVQGDALKSGLRAMASEFPQISTVRGLGLMVATEFRHPETCVPDAAMAARVQTACYEHDLLLLTCGPSGNVIRWIPPLIIGEREVGDALSAFHAAVKAAQDA
jgi:4-aminobutyrate aminotransferase